MAKTTRIEIGFGIGLTKDNHPISPTRAEGALHLILNHCLDHFGGGTVQNTLGAWRNDVGVDFIEEGRVLTLFVDNPRQWTQNCKPRSSCAFIKSTLDQGPSAYLLRCYSILA
jgi:hypothetical protein